MKKKVIEVAVKVIVAALTAFLTAITTTSCMGRGPIISQNRRRIRDRPPPEAGLFLYVIRSLEPFFCLFPLLFQK